MSNSNIPKVIHYCWFGGAPLPELAVKCMESWKKYCPDYEIKRWDESNFDLHCCDYVREAYAAKKWAFVSDYARFKILYENGGVYFDTDVELIKPIDDIVEKGPFMGSEDLGRLCKILGLSVTVNAGLGMAANAGLDLAEEILEDYHRSHFEKDERGQYKTVVERVTDILLQHGDIQPDKISQVAGITIYPPEYFCPLEGLTHKPKITENTRSIHYYTATWREPIDQYHKELCDRILKLKIIPFSAATHIARYIACIKFKGIAGANQETIEWMRRRRQNKE